MTYKEAIEKGIMSRETAILLSKQEVRRGQDIQRRRPFLHTWINFKRRIKGLVSIEEHMDNLLNPKPELDPRNPDHSRKGIFVYHNCFRCKNGKNPCVKGSPSTCDWPHTRND